MQRNYCYELEMQILVVNGSMSGSKNLIVVSNLLDIEYPWSVYTK